MAFLKWYLRFILKTPKALISPWGEYFFAVVLFFAFSITLGIAYSPYYLFLTFAVFFTMAVHAFWRKEVKK